MTKLLVIAGLIVTTLGVLTCVAFVIMAGVLYRIDEDNGLEPAYSPPIVGQGFEIGFWVFVAGVLTLIASAAAALLNKRRNQKPGAK